jgi:hypothetical protein
MTLLHRAAAALAVVAACVLPQPSQANTVFTDRAAFVDAAGSLTTLDFNGTAGPADSETFRGQSWSYAGVGFSTRNVIYSIGVNDGFAAGYAYGGDYLEWQDSSYPLTIVLPGPVRAVGLSYMEVRGTQDAFTIDIAGLSLNESSGSTPAFFGILADAPFATFTIADRGDPAFEFATIDKLSFGLAPAEPVPEPAPIAVLGAALLLLLPLHRRLRAASQPLAPPLHG